MPAKYIVAFSSKDEIIKVFGIFSFKTYFFVQIFAHFLIALFPLLALCFLMNFEELLGCMKYMKAMIIYFVRFVDRNNQTSVLGHKMTFFIRSFFALFPLYTIPNHHLSVCSKNSYFENKINGIKFLSERH